jgi:hypothetical protein
MTVFFSIRILLRKVCLGNNNFQIKFPHVDGLIGGDGKITIWAEKKRLSYPWAIIIFSHLQKKKISRPGGPGGEGSEFGWTGGECGHTRHFKQMSVS